MKTILVPTDFSHNAENALFYAIELAKKDNIKLVLLHSYEIKMSNTEVPYDIIAEEKAQAKKESEVHLTKLGLKIKHVGEIKYELVSKNEDSIDAILDTIKEKKIDLVVMGTKGSVGLSGAVFGSNTAKVIEKATCPVIAVPEEASFKGIKKITYATAFNNSDINGIKKVLQFAKLFNAQLNILHISDGTNTEEFEKENLKKFMNEVNQEIAYNNLTFQLLSGENIEETLEEYIDANSTSMLVMSTHHRDIFDKVFGKSITKHMALHTKIPLMTFHYNTKSSVKVF